MDRYLIENIVVALMIYEIISKWANKIKEYIDKYFE